MSGLLYGTRMKLVYFEFASFREQKYTAYDFFSVETVRMAKSRPSQNRSERSD